MSLTSVRLWSSLCENLTDAMIPLLNRGGIMKGFVQGADRQQTTLLPECLDDWVDESNPVRAVDVFVDALGARARCRCRAGAPGQESGCDAYSSRYGRASVLHAEHADGDDALSDEDAAQSSD